MATTGPDFGVVIGSTKLSFQIAHVNEDMDCSGIMLTDESLESISLFLTWKTFAFGDYLLLEYKVLNIKKSDGNQFHPLIETTSCQLVPFLYFWGILILAIVLVFFGIQLYPKKAVGPLAE